MKPDMKNEPLTPDEFEKLPLKITKDEFFEPVRQGIKHAEYSGRDGWRETLIAIFPDDSMKLIGFIGRKTGIRLSAECAELIEEVNGCDVYDPIND